MLGFNRFSTHLRVPCGVMLTYPSNFNIFQVCCYVFTPFCNVSKYGKQVLNLYSALRNASNALNVKVHSETDASLASSGDCRH